MPRSGSHSIRMEDVCDADGKSGKELFLELFRLLPSSVSEDYYVFGKWNDVDLRLDYDLLAAHRREAGADDAPTLEELTKEFGAPQLPGERPVARIGAMTPSVLKPTPAATSVIKPLGVSTGLSGFKPAQPKTAPPSAVVAAASTSGRGQSAELQQIALFIAKWKLEPTKTKLQMAKLTPPRRQFVMTNFAQSGTLTSPTAQVELFIAKCYRENSWGASSGATSGLASTSGLKRPLTAMATGVDSVKRAKVASPTPLQPGRPAWLSGQPAWAGAAKAAGAKQPVGVVRPASMTRGVGLPKAVGGLPRPGGGLVRPPLKPGGARPGSLIAGLLKM